MEDLFVAITEFAFLGDVVDIANVPTEILQGIVGDVAHADFLPVVDPGGAVHEEEDGQQGFRGFVPVTEGAVLGKNPGVIMVIPINGHIHILMTTVVPPQEGALETDDVRHDLLVFLVDGTERPIAPGIIEIEDHVDGAVVDGSVTEGHVGGASSADLPDGQAIVMVEDPLFEFLQVNENIIAIGEFGGIHHEAIGVGWVAGVREGLVFAKMREGVETEAIDPKVQVIPRDFVVTFAKFGVRPIHVRHLFGEDMKVEFIAFADPFPSACGEETLPVVGRKKLAAFVAPFADVVITSFFGGGIADGLLEPRMLVACVVHHEVQTDADAAFMGLVEETLKIVVSPIKGVHLVIIGYVVPVIVHGRGKNGTDPKEVYPQIVEVIQTGNDAGQIPNAVSVAVLKSLWIKNIPDAIAPPVCLSHAFIISVFGKEKCRIFVLFAFFSIFGDFKGQTEGRKVNLSAPSR